MPAITLRHGLRSHPDKPGQKGSQRTTQATRKQHRKPLTLLMNTIVSVISMRPQNRRVPQRAATLTQRLLAFSRRQTLDPKPTDVNRLILGIEPFISTMIGPSISIRVVTQGDLWPTKIDASQLENALIHLAVNARDAMPNGGEISIETSNVEHGKACDDKLPRSEGDFLLSSVADTGMGISPAILDKIFDPFFTTKPVGQGTGLGLPMIHGFVHQSGGSVHAKSDTGAGTTISLFLPRHIGETETTVSQPLSEKHGTEAVKIMVIDDESNIRMLMCDALREQGYAVSEAEDGPKRFRELQLLGAVDLLVTDVGLPGGMNGRQVADSARLLTPDLKVLFVTGCADNAAVDGERLERGMAVLVKPFPLEKLVTKVRQMLVSDISGTDNET